jgi:hypothetical protein
MYINYRCVTQKQNFFLLARVRFLAGWVRENIDMRRFLRSLDLLSPTLFLVGELIGFFVKVFFAFHRSVKAGFIPLTPHAVH